jgi:hypothetical protein
MEGVLELPVPDFERVAPDVLRQLGHPPTQRADDRIWIEVQQVFAQHREQIQPKALYKTTTLLSWKGGVLIGRDIRVRSKKWAELAERLVKPGLLCVFLVTLGQVLDGVIHDLQRSSLLRAYTLDAIGSVVAEHMAEEMEQRLVGLLGDQGHQLTARLSPGYCDWGLREGQEEIFRFLQPETVGVEHTSAGTMIPRKSVSATLVAAQGVGVKSPCSACSRSDCPYRRGEDTSENAS